MNTWLRISLHHRLRASSQFSSFSAFVFYVSFKFIDNLLLLAYSLHQLVSLLVFLLLHLLLHYSLLISLLFSFTFSSLLISFRLQHHPLMRTKFHIPLPLHFLNFPLLPPSSSFDFTIIFSCVIPLASVFRFFV